LMVMQYIILNC